MTLLIPMTPAAEIRHKLFLNECMKQLDIYNILLSLYNDGFTMGELGKGLNDNQAADKAYKEILEFLATNKTGSEVK